eukprot:scaffold2483_cov135-Isochrysis_galbana.AAC.5
MASGIRWGFPPDGRGRTFVEASFFIPTSTILYLYKLQILTLRLVVVSTWRRGKEGTRGREGTYTSCSEGGGPLRGGLPTPLSGE